MNKTKNKEPFVHVAIYSDRNSHGYGAFSWFHSNWTFTCNNIAYSCYYRRNCSWKKQGAGIGLVFGISSLVINTIQPTLTSFVFSPFISKSLMSAFIAIVPRVLIGYIAGLLFEKLKDKNEFMAMIVGSFLGAMTNTVLVLGGIYFIFGSQYASAIGKDLSALFPYLIGIITTSGLLEAIVGTMIAVMVSRILIKLK